MADNGLCVALVGCGTIAACHAAVLAADPRVAALYLCDPIPSRAEALRQRLLSSGQQVPLQLEPDLTRALDAVDAACILTPHHLHQQHFAQAVASGCHVLQEKPLATTPGALSSLCQTAQAARAHALVTACVFQHRFAPLAQVLQGALANGDLGEVQRASLFGRCTRTPAYYAQDSWRGTWAGEGGGLLINQMIHLLDLACAFMGPAQKVTATVHNRRLQHCIEVEDSAQGSFTTADGVVCDFDIENDQQTGWQNEIELHTSRGLLAYTPDGGGAWLPRCNHPAAADLVQQAAARRAGAVAAAAGKSEYGNLHGVQISDWLQAIVSGGAPRVSVAAGAVANALVLGCYQSTRLGAAVSLSSLSDATYAPPQLVVAS